MEDIKTIDKIMETVKENLELSADICSEYGYFSTENYLRKALVCLADARITKEFEESQKIEQEQIKKALEEKTDKSIEMVNPQLTVDEAIETMNKLNQVENDDILRSEEING